MRLLLSFQFTRKGAIHTPLGESPLMITQIDARWWAGRYLNFHDLGPVAPKRPTHRYSVTDRRSGRELGSIKWNTDWRQYAFYPVNSVFVTDSLQDAADFCRQRNAERIAARTAKK